MKLKITIGREQLMFFAIFLVALAFMGLVAAYGGSQPSVMGHSAGELDLAPLYISGGNVGIGTTSPTQKLDVQGSVNVIGNIYLPNLPAFSVRGVNQPFTSAGAKDLDYTPGARSFNVGGYFNDATNKFTAPVTGTYWFFANSRYDGADISYFRLYFSVNDAGLDYSLPHSIADFGTSWNPRYATQTIAGVIRLNAGDTIKVVADAFSDTAWSHQGEDTFSGYLVGGL